LPGSGTYGSRIAMPSVTGAQERIAHQRDILDVGVRGGAADVGVVQVRGHRLDALGGGVETSRSRWCRWGPMLSGRAHVS
jgi:hypothetical protein